MKPTIRFFIILFTIFTLTACVSVDTRLKREFEKLVNSVMAFIETQYFSL